MDYLWHLHYQDRKAVTCVLLVAVVTMTTLASGQSLPARLEIEATTTKEFGRVLSVRAVIKNETGHNIFLTNFLSTLSIERLNEQNQFEDYFDAWFVRLRFDSTHAVLAERFGIGAAGHDTTYDKAFLKELILFNRNNKDTTKLHKWCKIQLDQIETIKAHGDMKFQTNINSLPSGKYRFRLLYTSKINGVPILPQQRFKAFKIPNALLGFTRWTANIDSGYLYLNIK